MLESREHALAAESVERPEQHQVERAATGIGEQQLELRAFRSSAGFVVNVLRSDLAALLPAVLAKLDQLIFGVLASVFRGDPGVESNSFEGRKAALRDIVLDSLDRPNREGEWTRLTQLLPSLGCFHPSLAFLAIHDRDLRQSRSTPFGEREAPQGHHRGAS